MTGREHYRAAEQWLDAAEYEAGRDLEVAVHMTAKAQVHATLAVAAGAGREDPGAAEKPLPKAEVR